MDQKWFQKVLAPLVMGGGLSSPYVTGIYVSVSFFLSQLQFLLKFHSEIKVIDHLMYFGSRNKM